MMRKYLLTILLAITYTVGFSQNIYKSKSASIAFYSKTPMENIEAISNAASSVMDISSGEIIFKVQNTSFQFKQKLMQEHFNENYMESEKYPTAEFRGKITDKIDATKNGEYRVNVEGNLKLHGVEKSYKTTASLTVKDGQITTKALLKVKLVDHKITVPQIVFQKIAEAIDVTIQAVYLPKK